MSVYVNSFLSLYRSERATYSHCVYFTSIFNIATSKLNFTLSLVVFLFLVNCLANCRAPHSRICYSDVTSLCFHNSNHFSRPSSRIFRIEGIREAISGYSSFIRFAILGVICSIYTHILGSCRIASHN